MASFVSDDVPGRAATVRVIASLDIVHVAMPEIFFIREPLRVEQDDRHRQKAQPVVQAHGVSAKPSIEPLQDTWHRHCEDDGMPHERGELVSEALAGCLDPVPSCF